MRGIRFATYFMLFGQNKWLKPHLENIFPHFDKIYVLYGEKPWSAYNPEARKLFPKNPVSDLSILKKEPYCDKVELIYGTWDSEEQQRNAAIRRATKDGFHFLFDIDLDEFYFHEDLEKIKFELSVLSSVHNRFLVPVITFWRSFKYAVEAYDRPFPVCADIEIAVDLRTNPKHINKRRVLGQENAYIVKSCRCFHGSYVLSDEEAYLKIKTWGHAHQVVSNWYEEKWLNWTPETTDIHPVYPHVWPRAKYYDGPLPEVLKDEF